MKTASLDNKAWLVLGFFLPSFGSIGFKFQTSAASEERRDRCSAEKKAKKSAVASPLLCLIQSSITVQQQQRSW